MKSVRGKIIPIQILSIVVAAHVVNVRLVALVNVIAKEVRVAQLVDHALHLHGQLVQVIVVLGVGGRILAGQQRMENDDGLVQIPDEHALGHLVGRIVGQARLGGDAARGTGMRVPAASRPAGFRGGRCFGGHTAAGVGRYGDGRYGRMGVGQQCGRGGMAADETGGAGERAAGRGARFGGTLGQTGGYLETLAARAGRADVRRVAGGGGCVVVAGRRVLVVVVVAVVLLRGAELAKVVVAIGGVELARVVVGWRGRVGRGKVGVWRRDLWCGASGIG